MNSSNYSMLGNKDDATTFIKYSKETRKKRKTKIEDGNFYKSHAFLFILGPDVHDPWNIEEDALGLEVVAERRIGKIQYSYFDHNFHNRSMLFI